MYIQVSPVGSFEIDDHLTECAVVNARPRYAVEMEFGRDAIRATAIEDGVGTGISAALRAISRCGGLKDIVPALLAQGACGFGGDLAAVLTCGWPDEAGETLPNNTYASPESM
jgi:hypothetical protein